jgi:hypothetical protein
MVAGLPHFKAEHLTGSESDLEGASVPFDLALATLFTRFPANVTDIQAFNHGG